MGLRNSPKSFIALAVVCFGLSAASYTGLILSSDTTGQLVFGTVWLVVGLGWIGRYLKARRMNRISAPARQSDE